MVSSIEFGWFWYFRSCWRKRAVSSEISVQAAGLAQISRLRYVGRSWWGRIFSMLCTSQAANGVKDDQLKKCGYPMFSHAFPIFIPAVFWYWGALQTPWAAAIERTMETNRFNAKLKMRARKVSASWVSWVRGYSDKSWEMFRWYMPFVILCLWSQESSRAASLAQSKACLVHFGPMAQFMETSTGRKAMLSTCHSMLFHTMHIQRRIHS